MAFIFSSRDHAYTSHTYTHTYIHIANCIISYFEKRKKEKGKGGVGGGDKGGRASIDGASVYRHPFFLHHPKKLLHELSDRRFLVKSASTASYLSWKEIEREIVPV